MKVLIFVLLFISLCLCKTTDFKQFEYEQEKGDLDKGGENDLNQTIHWFENQKLDHFSIQPDVNWKQRYFVFDQYFDNKVGPLFLYICGEGRCRGVSQNRQFPIAAAKELNGIVITLEHRFYGESQPFGQNQDSYSLENLQYLSHYQALEDLAYFLEYVKNNKLHNVLPETPVICIGGSYPGALSAWFRYKYHHLTIGALASSAVVNAIRDFEDYDKQIGISTNQIGQWCKDGIKNLNEQVQQKLSNPEQNVLLKKQFNALMLTDDEFQEMIADNYAGMVQYGNTTGLCNYYITKNQNTTEQLQRFADMDPSQKYSSSFAYLLNTSYDIDKNARQWTFQTCTFFGWFQSAYIPDPMRSLKVDIEYFHRMCNYAFGTDFWPQTNNTNQMMGGTNMRTNNIIFTNGVQDPWQWASITKDQDNMIAYVADCIDCAHCVDLSTPSPDLPIQVTQIQTKILSHFSDWINQYWQSYDPTRLNKQPLKFLQIHQ